jgi:hypothetical protein
MTGLLGAWSFSPEFLGRKNAGVSNIFYVGNIRIR